MYYMLKDAADRIQYWHDPHHQRRCDGKLSGVVESNKNVTILVLSRDIDIW